MTFHTSFSCFSRFTRFFACGSELLQETIIAQMFYPLLWALLCDKNGNLAHNHRFLCSPRVFKPDKHDCEFVLNGFKISAIVMSDFSLTFSFCKLQNISWKYLNWWRARVYKYVLWRRCARVYKYVLQLCGFMSTKKGWFATLMIHSLKQTF